MKHFTRPLTAPAFAEVSGVSPDTLSRLEAYVAALIKWQKRINLVSRTTLDDVWARHILDSSQLHALLPKTTAPVVLDMGSGAGFPGLVLAIMGGCTVHMVESDTRKCAFLREVIHLTQANTAVVHNKRMEDMDPFPVDVVTSRALASLDKLLGLADGYLGTDTICLFLKGQKAQEELTESLKNRTMATELIQSQTDPSGTILKLSEIKKTPE